MPNAFNFSASPFDCLSPDEQRLVRDNVDVAYFPEGEVILDVGIPPTHLFVVIKGFVTQMDGTEVVTTYGPDDCFDGRALVAGKVSSRFVAEQEVVAYQLAHQAVSDLIASNATFGALLFSDLSNKLSALSERKNQHELQSLTMSRVDEAFLRPVYYVDYSTDILSVVKLFNQHRTSNVLVRDQREQPEKLGIFTATALQRAILDGRPLDQLAVGELSYSAALTVTANATVGTIVLTAFSVTPSPAGFVTGYVTCYGYGVVLQGAIVTLELYEGANTDGLSMPTTQRTVTSGADGVASFAGIPWGATVRYQRGTGKWTRATAPTSGTTWAMNEVDGTP
jgi:signal-transduction protein with cAMP-binding, CBS, and nucleotidyltransferase domain